MIRPLTCVCMLLAAGSGLYLYQTKHRSQMLDREIARTLKQTDAARDRIGVLRGEWALLNEPERLADLARQHLVLRTLAPTQFVAASDLGARLPAPLPPGSMPPAWADEPIVAAAPPAPAPAAAPATKLALAPALSSMPSPSPAAPAVLPTPPATQVAPANPASQVAPANPASAQAKSAPKPAAVAERVAKPAPRPEAPASLAAAPTPNSTPGAVQVTHSASGSSGSGAPGAVASPATGQPWPAAQRFTAPVVAVAARPAETARPFVAPAATPVSVQAASSSPQASALGGSRSIALPAPVPFGAASAR